MNVRGERILIFGDSLTAQTSATPSIWDVNQDSNRTHSAPGSLLASLLMEQGAQAVRTNARVSRSAWNFWTREGAAVIENDIAFKPTKVVVMLGTNDVGLDPTKDREAFQAIRDAYQAMGAEVWAIGPFISSKPVDGTQTVVNTMRSVFGGRFIDGRPLSEFAQHTSDGLHYTPAGARTLALALADALLSKPSPGAVWGGLAAGLIGVAAAVGLGLWWMRRGGGTTDFLTGSSEDELEDDDVIDAEFTEVVDERKMLAAPQLDGVVEIVNGKRFDGNTNELIRKGFKEVPCKSGLDEKGLARCWGKRGLDGPAPRTGPNAAIDSRAEHAWAAIQTAHNAFPDAFTKEYAEAKELTDNTPAWDWKEEQVAKLEKTARSIRQRAARLRKKKDLGASKKDADQRYRVAYGLVVRRDGEIETVRAIVDAPRGLTLTEAEKWRRQHAKQTGNPTWVETLDGEFVPVTGAKRFPKHVKGDRREGETHATLTSSLKGADDPDDLDEDDAPDFGEDSWFDRLRAKIEAKREPLRKAIAEHDAVFIASNDRRILLLKTPEMSNPEEGSIRVTAFDADGPIGHTTKHDIAALAKEISEDWSPSKVEPATEAEVIAFTDTDRFREGSERVARVQRANAGLDD